MGGLGAERPQETICRKILRSCRNFRDLNDKFWRILRAIMHKNIILLVLKHKFQQKLLNLWHIFD